MNPKKLLLACLMLSTAISSNSATADTITIGPNGINSAGLTLANGMPMNGGSAGAAGPVAIGQVELGRAGDAVANGGPDDSLHSSLFVDPAGVFRRTTTGATIANLYTSNHAEAVASVMIGTDTTDPDGGGPRMAPVGVSLGAALYSSAFDPTVDVDEEAAVTANHLATLPGVNVQAINFSFGNSLDGSLVDGNRLLTQFIDWSADVHDTLYVVAGNEGTGGEIPTDTFNGITVSGSAMEGGVYRRVAGFNTFGEDAEGDRTSVGLVAPGDDIDLTGLNAGFVDSGTSYAAPHVTATAALLHQYANERVGASAAGWDPVHSRRHDVMKAVLLNSADKFIDNETVTVPGQGAPVPQGSLLGMTRTVLKQPEVGGNPNPDWFNSAAWDDSAEGIGHFTPLDEQMGTGHLNASRARTQFATGELNADASDIPVIGWDYGTTIGAGDINRYRFAGELLGDSFISITLAWDRIVEFATDNAPLGQYNSGDTFAEYIDDGVSPPDDSVINDLDILLLPKFAASDTQAIALSDSAVGTVEHVFFQIPQTGEYEFWIRQHDTDVGINQDYGVAWWALASLPSNPPGDYNGDQIVDAQDYNEWRAHFGETVSAGIGADGNSDGAIDAADYVVWRKNVTAGSGSEIGMAVPAPSGLMLLAVGVVLLGLRNN